MREIFKTPMALLMFISIVDKTWSQTTSAYFFIRPIYAFAGNGEKLSENSATIQNVEYTKGVYGSYGRGLAIQAGLGKMINANFGLEIAGEYMHGNNIDASYSSQDFQAAGNSSAKINAVLLKPMVVLRNSGDLLSIYSKLGLSISCWSRRTETGELVLGLNNQAEQLQYYQVDQIKAKVGFAAAFGISARIKESMAFTAELNGQMLSLPVHKGYFEKYTLNGEDKLPSMSLAEKSWNYQKSISTAPSDPNKPGTKLYEPANFSYIGISLGLIFYL